MEIGRTLFAGQDGDAVQVVAADRFGHRECPHSFQGLDIVLRSHETRLC